MPAIHEASFRADLPAHVDTRKALTPAGLSCPSAADLKFPSGFVHDNCKSKKGDGVINSMVQVRP
jgi:hypothetical protein